MTGYLGQRHSSPPPGQVAVNPKEQPKVDLVVIRENTECLVSASLLLFTYVSLRLRILLVRQARNHHRNPEWEGGSCDAAHHRARFPKDR